MFQKTLIASLLALIGGSASAAGFYLIVPMATQSDISGIQVSISPSNMVARLGVPFQVNMNDYLIVEGDDTFRGSGVRWNVSSGALPSGMKLGRDGLLSGTPTTLGNSRFSIAASYRTKAGEQTYTLPVQLQVNLAHATLPAGKVGSTYASFDLKTLLSVPGLEIDATEATWTLLSGALPGGMTLSANGVLSGTPNSPSKGSFTVRATYHSATGDQVYTIPVQVVITLASATAPQGIVGQEYSGFNLKPLLTAPGLADFSPADATWALQSGSSLPEGLTLNTSTGVISGTPSAAATGSVTIVASYLGASGAQTFELMTLDIDVALASAIIPEAIVGSAFVFDARPLLTVTGDDNVTPEAVTWAITEGALPAGLTLNANGTVTGTPTAAASANVTLRATFRNQVGAQTYRFIVLKITVGLATSSVPEAQVGIAYSFDAKPLLSVSGDPSYTGADVSWALSSGSLPAGLTLSANGLISGTPTAAASNNVTLRASYRSVSGVQTYRFVAVKLLVTLAASTVPEAYIGRAYSFDAKTLLSVTGDATYTGSGVTWAISSGALPSGLTLNAATGVISGTPTAAGTANATLRASYKHESGTRAYPVVVLNVVVSLAAASLPQATQNSAYSYDFKPLVSVSGDPAYTSSAVSFRMATGSYAPAGMSLNTSGVLSGYPSTVATHSVNVVAQYRGFESTRAYSFNVKSASFDFYKSITSTVSQYNLTTDAKAAGWNGTTPLNATINISASGMLVSQSTGAYAFTTGGYLPAGSYVYIINSGTIVGAGGNGGAANSPGGTGGAALQAHSAVTITNYGTIAGGGGGGAGSVGTGESNVSACGAGGGGGQGAVSNGGLALPCYAGAPYPSGKSGSAGNLNWPGAGGAGAMSGYYPNQFSAPWYAVSGNGGDGGALGQYGKASGAGSGGNARSLNGGSPGASISGVGHVTWGATGTRLGPMY